MKTMPEHHKVVIAAAVAAACGSQARIGQIRAMNQNMTGKWTLQGRLGVQASHNFPLQRTWGPMPGRESN
jgi:hypothetical protein